MQHTRLHRKRSFVAKPGRKPRAVGIALDLSSFPRTESFLNWINVNVRVR
ncbi:hypothetical protein NC652_003966 [Populus alba x Populus x berolinensis]|nr:hypothetical protein NC652_003966 [Populus alba x Populus x berolinensis]